MKILLGITSSIAAYRMPNLVSTLRKENHEIICIITGMAKAFVAPQALAVMSRNHCYTDADEWQNTERVFHIELAKWCDIMVVVPLSANTLAKIANGLCDNLLTSTVRALNKKPLLLAPAMNTAMWENPITAVQLKQISSWYQAHVISPVTKQLADGDTGIGGLAGDAAIIKAINQFA